MGNLFGTDGVRGVANEHLTPHLAYELGRAGAFVLAKECEGKERPKIVIGKDTRVSGDMLEAALIAGICSVGVDALTVGVMPTPAIAFLTRDLGAAAGVVISASHNPVEDNGIKFFSATGHKLADEVEDKIEAWIEKGFDDIPAPVGPEVGRVFTIEDAEDRYVEFVKKNISIDLTGLKIVIDGANGAAYSVSPRIFRELGAEVVPIFNHPDGVNINYHCGSTHPEELKRRVVLEKADLGLAHDGDADRVLAVDGEGNLIDGDHIMLVCSTYLKKCNRLPQNSVVVTVMSNLGLHIALKEAGINVIETKVGDRYVMEELLKTGAAFGGEQSGHIIFLEHNTTGDGILTGLQLVTVVKDTGKSLKELAGQMVKYPQVLVNVRVTNKEKAMGDPEVSEAIKAGELKLEGKGRILVRPSGTEPLVRVMGEGPDQDALQNIVDDIAAVISRVAG